MFTAFQPKKNKLPCKNAMMEAFVANSFFSINYFGPFPKGKIFLFFDIIYGCCL